MNIHTQRALIAGPAGDLEVAVDEAFSSTPARGLAVVCHPHPLHGGTMDNKVAQTLARAFTQMGYRSVRFNYRGVGASGGSWDEGRGETDDTLAVIDAHAGATGPVLLAGFSFGGHVAACAAQALAAGGRPVARLLLVGPATQTFKVPPVPEDTIVIHAEADDVVPLSATLDWARPQSLPVVVVPGGSHFFHGQLLLLKSLVMRLCA